MKPISVIAIVLILLVAAGGTQGGRSALWNLADPIDAAADGYFIGANGVRLFYRKIGHGNNVVICLHGGPGLNIASGCLDAEPLANGRTLVMYDQRGSGRSDLVSDPKLLTANDHVRDLEALRQYLHAERITLIGFSWGAGLAALYTSEHPERVERLLLVAPLPPAKTPYWAQRLAKINEKLGNETVARVNEIRLRIPQASDEEAVALCRELRIGYRAYLANPANINRVRDRCDVPPASIRNGILVSRATLESLGDWDFRPQLASLRMPALVIEGAQTEVPLEATREWVISMRNARLLLIPAAGHELWAEQPAAFLKAAETFISGSYPNAAKAVRKSAPN